MRKLEPENLRVDVFRSGRDGAVRILHLPTGLSAEAEFHIGGEVGSSLDAKELAMEELEGKIAASS